jgi:hypothetical protein
MNQTPTAVEAANNDAAGGQTSDDCSVAPPPRVKPWAPPPPHHRHFAQEDDQDDGDFLPTYHKLNFPKFDGSCDPLPWLNRCEHYFCVRRTPDHKQVSYTLFHLLDDAQLWYHRLELNNGVPLLINGRFRPPMTDTPLGELALPNRRGSVLYPTYLVSRVDWIRIRMGYAVDTYPAPLFKIGYLYVLIGVSIRIFRLGYDPPCFLAQLVHVQVSTLNPTPTSTPPRLPADRILPQATSA